MLHTCPPWQAVEVVDNHKDNNTLYWIVSQVGSGCEVASNLTEADAKLIVDLVNKHAPEMKELRHG